MGHHWESSWTGLATPRAIGSAELGRGGGHSNWHRDFEEPEQSGQREELNYQTW